jgi:hypothetical protein
MRFLVPQDDADRRRRVELLERAVNEPEARAQVNSGKLAEPFWYIDSPLTTPAGDLSGFPLEPGAARPPVPGVLCPDEACATEGRPGVTRLRHLFGDGFVALVNGPDLEAVSAASRRVRVPLHGYRLRDLARPDRGAALAQALHSQPATAVLVRPDGHIAAVVPGDTSTLVAAVNRACGGA